MSAIELTTRDLQMVGAGLAFDYAAARSDRDRFATYAARPTSNPRRAAIFHEWSESAARDMAEIQALVASLPVFGQAYADELARIDRPASV